MWLGAFLVLIAIAAVIVAFLAGGVFTIVFIPIAALAVLGAWFVAWIAHRTGADRSTQPPDPDPRPGHSQATPDDLVRARQQRQ
jgi:hypothetical protein